MRIAHFDFMVPLNNIHSAILFSKYRCKIDLVKFVQKKESLSLQRFKTRSLGFGSEPVCFNTKPSPPSSALCFGNPPDLTVMIFFQTMVLSDFQPSIDSS